MLGLANMLPLAYTSNSFHLFAADVLLFIHLSITWPLTAGLPSIILPFQPAPSGHLDELYVTRDNGKAVFIHMLLFLSQLIFLLSLIWALLVAMPIPLFFGYIGAFIFVNMHLCQWFLDGPPDQKFFAGRDYAKNREETDGTKWLSRDPSHEGEKWVFINGVAVG